MTKKIYRMSSGVVVDMEVLRLQNEKSVAVGNMGVNAKGDKLGKNGKIVKPAATRAQEHHASVETTTNKVSLKEPVVPQAETKAEEQEKPKKARANTKVKKATEVELPDGSIQIIDPETDEGNNL